MALVFADVWCGQLTVSGWVLMGLFWATFMGLVLWAVGRLFGLARGAAAADWPEREVGGSDILVLRRALRGLDVLT